MKLKYLNIFFLIISIFCLIISGIYFYNYYQDKKAINNIEATFKTIPKREINTDDLVNKALYNPPVNKLDSYYNYIDIPFLDVDISSLKKNNPDVIGWLQVGNSNIDYPLVQTTNNSYYLNHNLAKQTNAAGWIFLDYRNNLKNKNRNTIIYGHRRLDNTMFGPLINVLDKSWFNNKNNNIIRLSSPDENTLWQIFSVYKIPKESLYLKIVFPNDTYAEFLQTIKNRSIYDFNTSINTDDYILTLSTCYDNFGTRIVVHAKLIKKETKVN